MKLTEKVKFALDETRMLILGAQILLGFQLRGAFQDGFDQLPLDARYLNGLALGLMLCSVALLIAPGPYHRLVEHGDDTGPFHRLVTFYADLALLPFALSLGIDLSIAGERLAGRAVAIAAGTATALMALALWYAMPRLRMRSHGAKERAKAMRYQNAHAKTPLSQKINQALTEGRVILPGAQALLGFQLAIVLTAAFEKLSALSQAVHAASLGLVAISVMLLMAPAAYHRIVFAGEDSPDMYRIGSGLITAATIPLGLGLAGDVFVVIGKIAGETVGAICAVAAALLLGVLWYGVPIAVRRRGFGAESYEEKPAE
ncbi:MAG TPA: DUF6328 family protein [Stellaceae bacterium]|nr:DUF6328 family protein [Stellaceae bacterium]